MAKHTSLTNAEIAELLALEAERAKMPAQKALRRASRRALMWPDEAAELVRQKRQLTELESVGPYIAQLLKRWIENSPEIPKRPEMRRQFLTITQAKVILARRPSWIGDVRGDLQTHTTWSDGDAPIGTMAEAAVERGYEYIAITDHTKALKIAGGIDERQLEEQAAEIAEINDRHRHSGLTVLRSCELNIVTAGRR